MANTSNAPKLDEKPGAADKDQVKDKKVDGADEDLTPTPTQAELDEAKLRKAAPYQTRDMAKD